jgi:hypothetical protein
MENKIGTTFTTLAFLFVGATSHAGEVKISPRELPKAVHQALETRFPQATITGAEKETDAKGTVIFDVELTYKGQKFETDIKDSGAMLEVEKEIASEHWPKELKGTIDSKYPHATIKEVMEVNKVTGKEEVPDHLEATIETPDKKSSEVILSLDGKTVRQHEEASEEASTSGEQRIKPQDLPKEVVAGLKQRFPKAEITGAEQGKEDGQQIFEVSIKSENYKADVTLDSNGKFLGMEKALSDSDRPAALIKALDAKYPHATIKLIEEVWDKDKMTGYEATIITADKKHLELDFDPQGKLIEDSK